jgi:hypothetical protein
MVMRDWHVITFIFLSRYRVQNDITSIFSVCFIWWSSFSNILLRYRQKSMIRLTHPFYHFCIVSIHLIMNIAEIMLAGCSAIINQSIIVYFSITLSSTEWYHVVFLCMLYLMIFIFQHFTTIDIYFMLLLFLVKFYITW